MIRPPWMPRDTTTALEMHLLSSNFWICSYAFVTLSVLQCAMDSAVLIDTENP